MKSIAKKTANTHPFIEFSQVNKWFDKYQALKNINLQIKQGEKIVICGPSGSGKSTLIRCINGLEKFASGTIKIDNENLDKNHLNKIRGKIGMVFQQFNLFPHLTVLENLTLAPIKKLKLSNKNATTIAMDLLNQVKIAEHAHKYPSQLSGGQQQRVAIARSLCMQPSIMLFDEPTSALDPEMINEVLDVIKELAHNNMTLVIVTHEMSFAREIADKIVFMDQGEIVEITPPKQFFTQPKQLRSQEFLKKILR